MQNRINWLDSAKGLGIIFVIFGHSCLPLNIHGIVYSFHMPLFFLLSGYFLFSKESSFIPFLKKKAKSLFIPYVIFNFVLIAFYYFWAAYQANRDGLINEYDYIDRICGIFVGFRNQPLSSYLWFLPCLFLAEFLLFPFRKLNKKSLSITGIVFIAISFAIYYFYGKSLPMSLDNAFIAASFIIVGILIRNLNLKINPWILIPIFIIYAVSTYVNYQITGPKGIDMSEDRVGNFFLFYISAITAIFLIFRLVKRFPNNKVLTWFGKNSLIIYCIHFLFLPVLMKITKVIPILMTEDLMIVRSLIILCGTAILCVPFVKLINRYLPWTIGKF